MNLRTLSNLLQLSQTTVSRALNGFPEVCCRRDAWLPSLRCGAAIGDGAVRYAGACVSARAQHACRSHLHGVPGLLRRAGFRPRLWR